MSKKEKYYKRPDGLYEAIRTIDGKRVAFRAKTQRGVEQKMLEYRARQEDGPVFQEVAERWEKEHFDTLSANTIKSYRPALIRAIDEFGSERIKSISPKDIDAYIKQFASKGYAQKTATNQLLIVRMVLEYACCKGLLSENAAAHIKIPKGLSRNPRRFPSDEEINIVKNSTDKTFGLFFYFILYTGCRLGETLALTWRDIDFEAREIHINKSVYYDPGPQIKEPKSRAGIRDIVLLDRLSAVLLPLKGSDSAPIFQNKKGDLWGNKQSWIMMEQYRRETGTKITPHQLRHGFATMLYEAGVDIKTSQYMLGHAQINTTMDIYTKLREKQKQKAAALLNAYDM